MEEEHEEQLLALGTWGFALEPQILDPKGQ